MIRQVGSGLGRSDRGLQQLLDLSVLVEAGFEEDEPSRLQALAASPQELPDGVEPVRSTVQGQAGFVQRHLQLVHLGRRDVRKIRHHHMEAVRL